MGFTCSLCKETDRWDEYSFEHIKPANEIKVIDYHAVNNIQCERNNEQLRLLDFSQGQEFLVIPLQKLIMQKKNVITIFYSLHPNN